MCWTESQAVRIVTKTAVGQHRSTEMGVRGTRLFHYDRDGRDKTISLWLGVGGGRLFHYGRDGWDKTISLWWEWAGQDYSIMIGMVGTRLFHSDGSGRGKTIIFIAVRVRGVRITIQLWWVWAGTDYSIMIVMPSGARLFH